MNTDYLRYFVTLAQVKHFGQAAERLYITQPNLSYAITALEKELGTQLLIRNNKAVALTNDGLSFLPFAEHILQELDSGISAIKQGYTESHLIRLGFAQTFFLPQILRPFQATNPDKYISFSLFHQSTSQIIRDLKNDKLDLGFCYCMDNEPSLEYIPIAKSQLVLIVPNGHPLSALNTIDLADTLRYPLICSSREPFLQHFIKDMFFQIGANPEFFCETETVSAAANLVGNNFGIAIVGDYPSLKNYPVKKLTIRNPKPTLTLALYYLKDRQFSQPVEAFRRFVLQTCDISNL